MTILIAEPFPKTESFPIVETLSEPQVQHAPAHVGSDQPAWDKQPTPQPANLQAGSRRQRSPVTPVAKERFDLHIAIGKHTLDKLDHVQALLSHSIPKGDLGSVLDRALDALIEQLEKRKFAATRNPRTSRPTQSARHIPASVKRAVWERDGGRCTFVGDTDRRCMARALLEYDHIHPVARGGRATVENLRLRCRAHNHHEAERALGRAFMNGKRQEARMRAEARKAALERRAKERAQEVIPWLRKLGFRADQAREAALRCEGIPEASLEERVKAALSHLAPNAVTHRPFAVTALGGT
jgi:5-methylcytosine-specific restriction endonuclease McrA